MRSRTAIFKQYTVTLIRPDGTEREYDGDIVAAAMSIPVKKVSAIAVTVPYSRRLPADTWVKHLLTYVGARPQVTGDWKVVFEKEPEVHIDKKAKSVYILWHTTE